MPVGRAAEVTASQAETRARHGLGKVLRLLLVEGRVQQGGQLGHLAGMLVKYYAVIVANGDRCQLQSTQALTYDECYFFLRTTKASGFRKPKEVDIARHLKRYMTALRLKVQPLMRCTDREGVGS